MIYRVWPRAAISQNTSMISSLLSIHPLPPCLMSSSSKNLVKLLSEQWPRPRGRLLRLLWHLDSAASSPLSLLLTVAVMDPNGLSSNTIRAHVLMTEPSAEKQSILLQILDPIKNSPSRQPLLPPAMRTLEVEVPLGLGVSEAVLDVVGGEGLSQDVNVLWLALVRGEHIA